MFARVLLLLPVGFPSNDNSSRKPPPPIIRDPWREGMCPWTTSWKPAPCSPWAYTLASRLGSSIASHWSTPGAHLGYTWASPGLHLGPSMHSLYIWIFILNVLFLLCFGHSTPHNNNMTPSSCRSPCSVGFHWDPRAVWPAWA